MILVNFGSCEKFPNYDFCSFYVPNIIENSIFEFLADKNQIINSGPDLTKSYSQFQKSLKNRNYVETRIS